jgi:hypothetical protein
MIDSACSKLADRLAQERVDFGHLSDNDLALAASSAYPVSKKTKRFAAEREYPQSMLCFRRLRHLRGGVLFGVGDDGVEARITVQGL